jgi:hypothetical protein
MCTLLTMFVLAKSRLSFNPELLDRSCRTNKDTRTSYSTEISSNIDLSTEDKFMWNKHKFERNRPSMYILMRTNEEYLQSFDEGATASSSSPCPTPLLK